LILRFVERGFATPSGVTILLDGGEHNNQGAKAVRNLLVNPEAFMKAVLNALMIFPYLVAQGSASLLGGETTKNGAKTYPDREGNAGNKRINDVHLKRRMIRDENESTMAARAK
jgi:hypothetical protein